MANTAQTSTREEVLARVRGLVAGQLAISPFEVKPDDDINTDLGLAGEDVVEILQAVCREFGTDFDDLGNYFQYFFYPEVSPMPSQIWLVLVFGVVGLLIVWVLRTYYPLKAILLIVAGCTTSYFVLKLRRGHQNRNYMPRMLRFSVDDIVDAVMVGKWVAPEDIWDRVNRLGRKRASS